ncbi:T9SS type A sorting domain-containing protein [Prevotella sp. P3-122]|uniref:T9SS type A sorting domain-containing protein n=1 Tax=Prevotella sp. P3-122 TaxID=2024223 RepID=UPI001483033A|nr:T9SS type A sorting domain-containing protein [Prevotella sp. P3-122]
MKKVVLILFVFAISTLSTLASVEKEAMGVNIYLSCSRTHEVPLGIPDAVKTDEEGHKMINYTAMIPMLVQAIQEMQSTIEAQAQKIDMLSNGTVASTNISDSGSKIIRCSPNPASGNVTITTKLQDGVSSGQLVISSMTGNREKTLVVSNVMPNVTENISSLNSGIHIVSLYVNGKLTDSQRLIIE